MPWVRHQRAATLLIVTGSIVNSMIIRAEMWTRQAVESVVRIDTLDFIDERDMRYC